MSSFLLLLFWADCSPALHHSLLWWRAVLGSLSQESWHWNCSVSTKSTANDHTDRHLEGMRAPNIRTVRKLGWNIVYGYTRTIVFFEHGNSVVTKTTVMYWKLTTAMLPGSFEQHANDRQSFALDSYLWTDSLIHHLWWMAHLWETHTDILNQTSTMNQWDDACLLDHSGRYCGSRFIFGDEIMKACFNYLLMF